MRYSKQRGNSDLARHSAERKSAMKLTFAMLGGVESPSKLSNSSSKTALLRNTKSRKGDDVLNLKT